LNLRRIARETDHLHPRSTGRSTSGEQRYASRFANRSKSAAELRGRTGRVPEGILKVLGIANDLDLDLACYETALPFRRSLNGLNGVEQLERSEFTDVTRTQPTPVA
jgi:hypothetical protein